MELVMGCVVRLACSVRMVGEIFRDVLARCGLK